MIPDAEKVIIAYLNEASEIQALGAEVGSRTPSSTAEPWVTVTQIDARAVGNHRSDHLIEWVGQFDCYAGKGAPSQGQKQASELVRTVREALRVAPDAELNGAVVTGAAFGSCPRLPDPDVGEPARERYALTATLWLHS